MVKTAIAEKKMKILLGIKTNKQKQEKAYIRKI